MSRRVVTEFEITEDRRDLIAGVLDDMNVSYTEKDGTYHVAKVDGSYIGSKVVIRPEENEISHTDDPAPSTFVEDFRQEFSRQKFHREASIQGHNVHDEWVSDGDESHHLLEEVEEGDVVIEASVSF